MQTKAIIYRLSVFDGEENLYRHHGGYHGNGVPYGVEAFVKDRETRAIVGRWLPCPNWCVTAKVAALRLPTVSTITTEEHSSNG